MRVFEEKRKSIIKRTSTDIEVFDAEPHKPLFKVVVNNYREEEKQSFEIEEMVVEDQHGLPPQPTEYLKYPTYDWF